MQLETPSRVGSYEILRLAGRGAMGEVYEACDLALDRKVALKVLSTRHLDSDEFLARFEREGRALAALNHPNVLQIYECGQIHGRPYLAMEYLEGEDIGAKLKRDGPLLPQDAAEVIRQAAIGLAETVEAGVVHRDVKPSNILVNQRGRVIVTDFGLSKTQKDLKAITKAGLFVGTPDYLAPEQALGRSVNEAADIYALGCSLFHMCTGRPPFREAGADDPYTQVVRRHLKAKRPRLREEIPDIDEELSLLCRKMMSRRIEVRPSYPELISALGVYVQREQGMCPPRPARPNHQLPIPNVGHESPSSFQSPILHDRYRLLVGIGIGVIGAVTLMVLIRWLSA